MNTFSLLRQESFGGTLNNAISGKRVYVDVAEFEQIAREQTLPENLQREIKADSSQVLIRRPALLPGHNFSAPDTIFFEVTRICNLTCTICFNESGRALPHEMSDKERVSIVEDLCKAGVQEVRFTGGEPLVVGSIFDLIHLIRESGLRASIGTNGVLVTQPTATRLAAAGLNAAVTSIDGLESVHDSIRGFGAFRRTMRGIQELIDAGISVRVNTVVMKSNFEEVIRVTEYFSERKIPVMICRLIPAGRADQMTAEMLTQVDYTLLRQRLDHLLSDPTLHVRGHYLKDDRVPPRVSLPFERRACSAGHRGLVVLPDGRVQTCGFLGPLGESAVGNLKHDGLALVWSNLVESRHIESMRDLLPGYNAQTSSPQTNCLAIAMAGVPKNVIPLKVVGDQP